MNIAIDGHAGSGKSTVAERLSDLLGYKLLNTGEIYRSFACAYLEENLGDPNDRIVENFIKNKEVVIKFVEKEQFVYINNVCYKSKLRDEKVSMMTSKLSAFKPLRDKLVLIQRQFANENNCIMEGRDIGTVVLPNAEIKLFITASQEVRAKRRFEQVVLKDKNADLEKVLEDLKQRDYNDENRNIAPLKCADDAILVDNTNLNIEETVQKCLEIISKKLKR